MQYDLVQYEEGAGLEEGKEDENEEEAGGEKEENKLLK